MPLGIIETSFVKVGAGDWGWKWGVNLYPGGIFHGIRGTEVDLL